MANAREIQNRIKIIQYMMSSMKLRKAKKKLEDTEPYFIELQKIISEILLHFPDMRHMYFDNRAKDMQERVKKKGYVIITGDKGLAGAYNHNVMKEAQRLVDESSDYKLYIVGELEGIILPETDITWILHSVIRQIILPCTEPG